MPRSYSSPSFDYPNNIRPDTSEEAPDCVCNFLLPDSASSHLRPNTFLSSLLSSTFTLCPSFTWQPTFHTVTKQRTKL
jgi:hypothetical protein